MSEYLITARDGACRAGLSIQALRVVRFIFRNNYSRLPENSCATWAFYHRLESNRSSTEYSARRHAHTKVSHVTTVGKNIAQPGTDQSQTSFWVRRRGIGTHNTVDGRDGRRAGTITLSDPSLSCFGRRSCWPRGGVACAASWEKSMRNDWTMNGHTSSFDRIQPFGGLHGATTGASDRRDG